jgi:hypothetical protein
MLHASLHIPVRGFAFCRRQSGINEEVKARSVFMQDMMC